MTDVGTKGTIITEAGLKLYSLCTCTYLPTVLSVFLSVSTLTSFTALLKVQRKLQKGKIYSNSNNDSYIAFSQVYDYVLIYRV